MKIESDNINLSKSKESSLNYLSIRTQLSKLPVMYDARLTSLFPTWSENKLEHCHNMLLKNGFRFAGYISSDDKTIHSLINKGKTVPVMYPSLDFSDLEKNVIDSAGRVGGFARVYLPENAIVDTEAVYIPSLLSIGENQNAIENKRERLLDMPNRLEIFESVNVDKKDATSRINNHTIAFNREWQTHLVKDTAYLLKNIPDLKRIASNAVSKALKMHGFENIQPNHAYLNEFKMAVSDRLSFNGWSFKGPPVSSMTLTEAALKNSLSSSWANLPLDSDINSVAGIYNVGSDDIKYNSKNEIKILASDFRRISYDDIDIANDFKEASNSFWRKNDELFERVMRDSFSYLASHAFNNGELSSEQFHMLNSVAYPERYEQHPEVILFDVYGYPSTDIILIEEKDKDSGVMYIPGSKSPFLFYDSEKELRRTLHDRLITGNDALSRHFSLYNRQDGVEFSGVDSALKGIKKDKWSDDYFMLKHLPIQGDVFRFLRESYEKRLEQDADIMTKSNSEAKRDYFLEMFQGVFNLLPALELMAPEVGVPLALMTNLSTLGLEIDKAIEGDTLSEREEGVTMASMDGVLLSSAILLPTLGQLGEKLETAIKDKEALSLGSLPEQSLGNYSHIPKVVTHPVTGEELIGVKITNENRDAWLKSIGNGRYHEVDSDSGRVIQGKTVVRASDYESGKLQWLTNYGLKGGGEWEKRLANLSHENIESPADYHNLYVKLTNQAIRQSSLLSDESLTALERYQEGEYLMINKQLKGGRLDGTKQDLISQIDNAFTESPKYTGFVFRGADNYLLKNKNLSIGDIVSPSSYLSTSVSNNSASNFYHGQFELYILDKGQYGIVMPNVRQDELEVLINRNSYFEVMAIERNEEGSKLILKELVANNITPGFTIRDLQSGEDITGIEPKL
ncbi:hypothetical protein THF1D04_500003 [Vibrio owensii]|uniref:ADP ribosyltransferase domain-containing protein n=1 Tax=Vibrio owensii TaxID=696485 RepID=A0AAU9QAM7_9VIBR|nr:hypothetical protein THF1D04_500003 [Vibrio owensii]